jgi:hypothetical protein
MIVTHSNKFLTPKSKVVGAIFNSQLDIPNYFISSNSVNHAKRFWANPASAASYKEAKTVAEKANLNGGEAHQNDFPDFVDLYSKQLFLKTNKEYIIHTPLTSCALVEEFTTTAREMRQNILKKNWSIGFVYHQVQPRGVTLGNRGELAVNHGGGFWVKAHPFLGCLRKNDAIKINLNENKKYLYFYGSLDNANLNSGFISAGLPAMTAVGGMVESIELKLGYDKPIPFALGVKNCHLSKGGKLGGTKSTKSADAVVPVLVTEEKTGSLDFVIVLDVTNFNSTHISDELKKIKRLSGGAIFNCYVSDSISESSEYFFIRNFKYKMQDAVKSGNIVRYLITRRLHPIACGYATLETPNYKTGVYKTGTKIGQNSHKYQHAFSETLFLPIKLSRKLDCKSFFQRKIYDNCTVYE